MEKLNLRPLSECITSFYDKFSSGEIQVKYLNSAPSWLRLISGNQYCAYKNTIYVPQEHLALMATGDSDLSKILAVAKLLPWLIAIDENAVSTKLKAFLALYNYKIRARYFVYEYGFLLNQKCSFTEHIFAGFVSSRRTLYGKKIPAEKVVDYLKSIM